jgi:diguanylate cyclase (GGDEF)-like protein/PAS domain S-box-containing protein
MPGERSYQMPMGEGFLLSVLEGSTDCIKVLNKAGRLLFINGPGVRLFEASAPSDVIGSDWACFWPEPFRQAAREAIRAAAEGRPARFDGTCPTMRSTLKRWDNALGPIFNKEGEVECIICISRDVSERRDTEDKLRVTQAFLDQVLEHVPVGVFVKNASSGVFERVNHTAERLYGLERDHWVGKTDADLFPGDQAEFFLKCDLQAIRSRETIVIDEEALDTPHRGRRLMRTKKVPLYHEDGSPLHIVGVTEDITESRATEKALRESEERLARAVAAARMGVWEWYVGTGEFHASSGLEALYGRPPGSIRCRADVHASIHPNDLPAVNEAMGRSLQGKDGGASETELRTSPANGPVRWLRVTGRSEVDADGRPFRLSGVTQDVTARREAEARVAYMAHHDPLTGLLNRSALRERLADAAGGGRRGEPYVVLHLDLDRFKEVNDTFGHPAGDALLRSVAARLLVCVRETDAVARLGGDEFVILCQSKGQPHDVAQLAARVIEEIRRPHDVDGRMIAIGVSIGVAAASDDSLEPSQVMTHADLALYQAKREGGERFCFFEHQMQVRAQARRCLEADLQQGLQKDEFELHYQPLIHLTRGCITGFEALVRWRHPHRGLVQPDAFIPIMEEMRLIVPMGRWILSRACADAAAWPDGLKVAVNLSAAQFSDPGLEDMIAVSLAASGLPAGRLELEITESLLLLDTEHTVAVLGRLRETGVSISMDDFGTGYSSLSYLLKLPIDKVKIDRSFVLAMDERPEGAAIIRAVAGLCQTLGIVTTAEGIETPEQMKQVISQGCTEGQGYLFSPPRPAADVPAMLAQWEVRQRCAE